MKWLKSFMNKHKIYVYVPVFTKQHIQATWMKEYFNLLESKNISTRLEVHKYFLYEHFSSYVSMFEYQTSFILKLEVYLQKHIL